MQPSSRFDSPLGYRFLPSDCELLRDYLYIRVNGLPFPHPLPFPRGFVDECDVYGSQEPWELWELYGRGKLLEDDFLYFFTQLKEESEKDSTICRTTQLGAWREVCDPDEVEDTTETVVGLKKFFIYENEGSQHHGRWIMDEFSLLGDHEGPDQIVLCKIGKNNDDDDDDDDDDGDDDED